MRAPVLKPILAIYTGLFLLFLYGPLLVLGILSFQKGPEGGPQFPIIQWSTYWYRFLFGLVPPSRIAPLPIEDGLPGLVAVALFGFTLSYDEFSRTLFASGPDLTLPLAIYGTFSVEIHPNIFAFGVLTTLFSLALLGVYAVLMSLSVRRAQRSMTQEEA